MSTDHTQAGSAAGTRARDPRYNSTVTQAATEPRSGPTVLMTLAETVERDLVRRLDAFEGPQALREALKYSVLGGGKRLRPALTLLSCEAAGGSHARALPAAAAVELVHSFSLVHDDLPAMDDDALRRGRPSLHVHAGEAMAVLTGDVMMPLAFEWIVESDLSPQVTSRLVAELARATTHMIGGQVYDTLGGFPPEWGETQRLEVIHRHKTAALIQAACRMGAICGEASPDVLDAISRYGAGVGLMFQIVDDLLDVTQSAEHIGKATGKDERAGKLTHPGTHGREASKRAVERLRAEAHEALRPLGDAAAPLLELCDYMAVRTK